MSGEIQRPGGKKDMCNSGIKNYSRDVEIFIDNAYHEDSVTQALVTRHNFLPLEKDSFEHV